MPAYTKRVVINRRNVAAVRLAAADGLFQVGRAVLAAADPPDAPPFGTGLLEGGGAIAYVDGRKVAGTTIGGRQIKKPRAAKTPSPGTWVIVGFGYPGRLVHNGSINNRPNPFLARAKFRVLPAAPRTIMAVARRWLKRIR